MDFDIDLLEDRIVTHGKEAVSAGLLSWFDIIGSEEEAARMPKVPGVAVLLRRGGFGDPMGIDVTRSIGVIEWSFFARGENLRKPGLRSGRKGARGAYHAMNVVWQYFYGWEIDAGVPMWIESFDLVELDRKAGFAMYEVALRHQRSVVQLGYD